MLVQPSSFSPATTRQRARLEIAAAVKDFGGTNAPGATIAVIDNFSRPDELGMTHGDKVARVFEKGGVEPQRVLKVPANPTTEATISTLTAQGDPRERLEAFIKGGALDFLESTQAQVEKMASLGIKTINHSQSLNAGKPATFLLNLAFDYSDGSPEPNLTDTGRFLCQALSLPESADWDNEVALRQGLVDKIQDIYGSDPEVTAARDGFNEKLAELKGTGLTYFTAAGNDQRVLADLRRMGLQVSESMVYGLNSVAAAVVVGAFDDMGTADTTDDKMAEFSVRNPQVDFVAQGTRIDLGMGTLEQGTSFATPLVALRYERLREAEPYKDSNELLRELASNAGNPIEGSLAQVIR